jgi:hypothetical protein
VLLERVELAAERPVIGITDADCYAGTLNFVFGVADLGGNIHREDVEQAQKPPRIGCECDLAGFGWSSRRTETQAAGSR